jgi:hypothetical protein
MIRRVIALLTLLQLISTGMIFPTAILPVMPRVPPRTRLLEDQE